MFILFIGLIIAVSINLTNGIEVDKEMTLVIDPGQMSCFFESAKAGQYIDLEYTVLDGGHGNLDISFTIAEANGKILFTDYKRYENIHRVDVKKDMSYRFCFDNSFSTFNKKTVFFELIIETEGETTGENSRESFDYQGLSPEDVYDVQIQDINDSIFKVKAYLQKAKQYQDVLKSFEARDRNIAEENFYKVNIWSFFQILLMLAIGSLQVFMVKSLFDTDSKAHKLWHKFKRFS